jgi:Flp pilus assembly protein TadG
MTRRPRDERGNFAILFALMAVMLLTVAALGTDLGNAISRHTDTQNQADFAALDGGRQLTDSVTSTSTVPDAFLDEVTTSLNSNQPQDDNRACWRTHNCVAKSDLTDADLTNGDVRVVTVNGKAGVQVTAPTARVDFGFANVFGVNGTSVGAKATVNIFSEGPRVLPMFAVSGCDWGRQTLTDPANGQVVTTVPPLAYDSDTNHTNLTDGSIVLKDNTGTILTSLATGSTGNSMTIQASKWSNVTKIGFFRSDDTDPFKVVEQPTFNDANTGAVLTTPYSSPSGGTIGLTIPDTVAATETLWYVRAYSGVSNQWSPRSEAQPIRVGQTLLECSGLSSDGNFGTLSLPRSTGSTSQWLPRDMAYGLESPLSLHVHQYAIDNSTDGTCTDGTNGAITPQSGGSNSPLNANANCVPTDTGLPANVATEGLITVDNGKGLLVGKSTHAGCAPGGGNSMRSVTLNNHSYSLNDDTLSCFLINGKTLADISSTSYGESDGVALSDDILDSPRFAYVPVLQARPSCGTCQDYSIIDFRPAFITDETATTAATTDNGVTIANNDVKTMKVFFFSYWALPHGAPGPMIDYLGVGPKVVYLIN